MSLLYPQFPDPVIKIAIEPKSKADLEKMSNGLIKLAQEDPSFHFSRDEETNQTVIEGMGELHLVCFSLLVLTLCASVARETSSSTDSQVDAMEPAMSKTNLAIQNKDTSYSAGVEAFA